MKDVHLIYGLGLALSNMVKEADRTQRPGGGDNVSYQARLWVSHFDKWANRQDFNRQEKP